MSRVATCRAVPNCQADGSVSEGVTLTSAAFTPSGYSTTVFQLRMARFSLVEAPAENPTGASVARKSTSMERDVQFAGTVRWNAYRSEEGRVGKEGRSRSAA